MSAASLGIEFPDSYPVQPELREWPDNPADASIARGAIPYDEIAPKLNDWMDETDILSTQVVGQSANGYDIYLVTVTAPETAAETAQQETWRDEVKYNAAAASRDDELLAGYKDPIWFNGNIHGNEWEGTDASLDYIEYLIENENTSSVKAMLDQYRMYFTVTNNPDGRILGQRPNGMNLDLNRDFVTNVTPETTLIRDLTALIQPIFFIDLHGYTNVLQIEPCGPPHGENYDYDLFIGHAYAAALKIEEDVVDAAIPGNTYRDKVTGATSTTLTDTSGIIIPFRDTPSGWDDWPPVFTAQYVAYQGAISYTAELPLGRTSNATTSAFNSAVDTKVGFQVIDSTMDYIVENDDEILKNQIEIFRRGAAGEPLRTIDAGLDASTITGPTEWVELWDQGDANGHDQESVATFPRGYVIPSGDAQRSDSDAAYLVDFLLSHGVQVSVAKDDFTAEGVDYEAGSYIVDMHQPLRGLANALLAAGSDISAWVPSMYDISAWSHGYLWGATVTPIGSTEDANLPVATSGVTAAADTSSLPAAGSYLTFELDGVDDFAGLNALLADDVPASMVGTNTVVIGNDTASYEAAAEVADEYGVAFEATTGLELAGDDVKPLDELQIAYTGTQDDLQSLKQLGFAADQLTLVTAATLQSGATTLDGADVLWLGSALAPSSSSQPVAYAQVQSFVAAGKGTVGRGTGAATFANTWYDAKSTTVSGNSSGNGVVHLDTVSDGVLGELDTEYGFVYPAYSFALDATGHGTVEQTYGEGNPLISGHWRQTTSTNGPTAAAGRASAFSATLDSGAKAMVFGTSVFFRAHPRGHFSEAATALYWTAKPATDDVLTAPVATETTLSLSSAEAVYGAPATATVKVAAAGNPSRKGTVSILDGTETIATVTVNSYGNGKVTLPADLAVGAHALSAVFTPQEGSALAVSTSAAVDYTVTKAASTVSVTTKGAAYGRASTATAVVTGPDGGATGKVTFTVDGRSAGSATISGGTAKVSLPVSLTVGTHKVVATYAGDAVTSGASSSTVSVKVTKASTTSSLKVASTLKRSGAKATVTVKVPGAASSIAPSGKITVRVNGKAVKTFTLSAADKGSKTFTLPKFAKTGTAKITVTYGGSSNLSSSVSPTKTVKVRG
ncbi:hypothetical protein GCM10025738_01990 [Microbacterium fluvii]